MSIVIKPLIPKIDFGRLGAKVVAQLKAGLRRDAEKIKADYEKTTATWTGRPSFRITMLDAGGAAIAMVGTDDEIYGYVDRGTKPHKITARNVPYLKFQVGGFRPKTRPGFLGSSAGAMASGQWVQKREIDHPGTEARGFTEKIQNKHAREIPRRMQRIIDGLVL